MKIMKKDFKGEYAKQRLDPRWQKKRLEVLARDNWTCMSCCEKDKTMHVHHNYYVKNRMPWEYPNYTLVSLCCDCHKEIGEPREVGEGENNCTELESTLELFLAGQSQFCVSPAFWELACLANCLTKTAGISRFDVEGAMIEGLLRLWKQTRKDEPPVWLGTSNVRAPWASDWVVENFGK